MRPVHNHRHKVRYFHGQPVTSAQQNLIDSITSRLGEVPIRVCEDCDFVEADGVSTGNLLAGSDKLVPEWAGRIK